MYENYLAHYGVIGMKWGQRRLTRRINRAKARGDKTKVAKLKNRLAEEKTIEKMDFSDKFLLSREGVLANQRLIAKGQPKARRLIKLHGMALVTEFTADYVAGRLKPKAGLDIDMTTGKISVNKTNYAISLGIEAAKMAVTGRARDFMYSKVGRG